MNYGYIEWKLRDYDTSCTWKSCAFHAQNHWLYENYFEIKRLHEKEFEVKSSYVVYPIDLQECPRLAHFMHKFTDYMIIILKSKDYMKMSLESNLTTSIQTNCRNVLGFTVFVRNVPNVVMTGTRRLFCPFFVGIPIQGIDFLLSRDIWQNGRAHHL